MQSINLDANSYTTIKPKTMPLFSKNAKTNNKFYVKLCANSNAVAYKKQIYLSNYNTTYFKYY
jgi:hypothetical protein